MNRKATWAIIAVILIVLVLVVSQSKHESDNLTVGAVLPLSGPAALWGETFKNGMELALTDKPGISILYEDSKSTAHDGVSAYNLLQTQGVDLTVAELSSVSVPLSKIALERRLPLLVSLVATEHSNIVNDYTTRYYTDPTNYAMPAFADPLSPVLKAKKIAVLTRNDELGVFVNAKIMELAASSSKEVVFQDSFMPNENDFRTILAKIKNSGAEVLIFVVANPGEALGIVRTAKELSLAMHLVESSAVFADLDTRKQVGDIPLYSTSYDFSSPGKAIDFKNKYLAKFGKEPNFGAAFGYDVIGLIDTCKNKQEAVRECLSEVNQIEGVAGTAIQSLPGDFVVKLHLEKVN